MITIINTKIIKGFEGSPNTRHADIIISDGNNAYPWRVGGLPLIGDLQEILDAREPELWKAASTAGEIITDGFAAKRDLQNLPGWATWTGQEAADFVRSDVLSGMTKAEAQAWVDTNVVDLASARASLRALAGEMVDLREIVENAARAIMYLRDISVER